MAIHTSHDAEKIMFIAVFLNFLGSSTIIITRLHDN